MNSSDNFQDSALSRLMPLMNSSFTPGQAQATVDNFQDPDQRQIAQAELYYLRTCRRMQKYCGTLSPGQRSLSAPVRSTFIFFFQSYSGQSICFQNGIQKYSGMSSCCKRQFCTKRSHGFLCFRQLSGHGTDASSHRRTSSSSGFSAIFTFRASRLCCLCTRS